MKLIFLDTETTGNDVTKDRLCQVCYRVGDEIRTEYFKPPMPIPVKATSITHITNKMVADKQPFQGSTMHKDLAALLVDNVLVAHNAEFDCAILESEGVKIPHRICTLRVARFLDPEGIIPEYGLQYLRHYLDLEIEANAHDAEGDVKVLYAIFQRLLSKVKEKIGDEAAAIEEMITISSKPSLFKKFNFGKYKDKTVAEVAATDRGYLEWLLKQKQTSGEKDEDWIYTLQEHLK